MKKDNKKSGKIKMMMLAGLIVGSLIIAGGTVADLTDIKDQSSMDHFHKFIEDRDLENIGWQSEIGNGEPAGTVGKPRTLCYQVYKCPCQLYIPRDFEGDI